VERVSDLGRAYNLLRGGVAFGTVITNGSCSLVGDHLSESMHTC